MVLKIQNWVKPSLYFSFQNYPKTRFLYENLVLNYLWFHLICSIICNIICRISISVKFLYDTAKFFLTPSSPSIIRKWNINHILNSIMIRWTDIQPIAAFFLLFNGKRVFQQTNVKFSLCCWKQNKIEFPPNPTKFLFVWIKTCPIIRM